MKDVHILYAADLAGNCIILFFYTIGELKFTSIRFLICTFWEMEVVEEVDD